MTLLDEISAISRKAAQMLEKVDFCTDQDIRSLSENDLQELLPGPSNIRSRKKIYEVINKKRSIHAVLNELKGFTPDELLRSAFSSKDSLQMLKDFKSEVYRVQEFLDAQIDLLEKFSQREDTSPNKSQASVPSLMHVTPGSSSATYTNIYNHNCNPQKAHYSKIQVTVTYKVRISGKTLNTHMEVLEKIKHCDLHLQEAKPDEDSQLTILFCPVVSRAGTDVGTALDCISDDEQVILVIMHHSRSAFPATVGQVSHNNVVLIVNVFFHETVPGLLNCLQNDEAINKIRTKLRSFSDKTVAPFRQHYSP